MKRIVIIDTETTGLSPKQGHRVIEIGAVEMVNRRLTGARFHHYLNPDREVEEEAIAVHGIRNDFLADKPRFPEVADAFYAFIEDALLVAHNATFDVGFLDHELQLTGKEYKKLADYCDIFDTLPLARKLHPGQRNSLDALCKRYDITHFDRSLHGALLDAEILAQVYLAMTGGQSSLFAEAETSHTSESPVRAMMREQRGSLPVIHADAQELEAHEAFLALLSKQAGGAV